MIKALRLTNFRSHAQTVLELEPITLLVGPAGAGKSNLFKAMVKLQNSIHRTLLEMFPPGLDEFQWVRSRWAGETDPIGFEVDIVQMPEYPNTSAKYTLRIADSPPGLYVLEETLMRRQEDEPWDWVFQRRRNSRQMGEFGVVEWDMPTILHRVWHGELGVNLQSPNVQFAKAVATALSRFGYYHLEAGELKSLGTGQVANRIGYYGEGIPDFIAWTKSDPKQAPIYASILTEMREICPALESIIVTQARSDRQGIAFAFREHRGFIAAPDLSDGTMFTLGMLCIFAAAQKPHVLCIEEPETGLHPRRLRWILDKLLTLAYPSAGTDPTQIVLTTHSPSFVDLFKEMLPSVQVVEQVQGRTRITSLPKIIEHLHMDAEQDGIGYQWATGLFEGL